MNRVTSKVYMGVSMCVGICVNFTYQDSDVQLSVGGAGVGGFGYAGGVNNFQPNTGAPVNAGICLVIYTVGPCFQGTKLPGTHTLRAGGGIAIGEGLLNDEPKVNGSIGPSLTLIDGNLIYPPSVTTIGHHQAGTAIEGAAAIPLLLLAIAG